VEVEADRRTRRPASGGRYQVEKLMTIAMYLVIVVATVAWVASTDDASNELGAEHGFETIAPLNNKIFFLENESGDDWTNVRIVLNNDYLYTVEKVPEANRVMLRPEDFHYFYWVPRPWGRESWEAVNPPRKPGQTAGEDLKWETVQVRATEGRLDIKL
jgi:hypothetical protein